MPVSPACLALTLPSALLAFSGHAAPMPNGFVAETSASYWVAQIEPGSDGRGGLASALVFTFPGQTWSKPGDMGAITTSVTIPDEGVAELSFRFYDSFMGPTAGYHFAEVLLNDMSLFERDAAGGTAAPEAVTLDLRRAAPKGGRATLTFRLADRKAVSNFPLTVHFVEPVLRTATGDSRLLPPVVVRPPPPLPPDLPLPSLSIAGEDWTRTASIVQPWGRTQFDAVVNAETRGPFLAGRFGFNAVILLPPEAHNAISPGNQHVTEDQFSTALNAFRAAGFRVILYSSIMHCGHAPVWQTGKLSEEHPEWSQRGPEGEPVKIYGAEWLCPSTPALTFTLDYARTLVRSYKPDAIMLDNNEFFATPSGLTCHCTDCQSGFRRYTGKRFGERVLGQTTAVLDIPVHPGPLYNIWLHWRNRVWAEALDRFRRELREERAETVVLANTQYLRAAPDLATDAQYAHEDAVLSESRGLATAAMVNKLLLGKALARDRPLWNYLGTFRGDDLTRLVGPNEIAMNVSTAFGCGARPWIVYYGFYEHPDANRPSLDRMAETLEWHRTHAGSTPDLKPYAPVRSLVSLTSRNCLGARLLPAHLAPLRELGICTRIVEEQAIEEGALAGCRVLLIEDVPCLSKRAANAVAAFVRSGGTVVASPDTGLYDEIGRPRPLAMLWQALGLNEAPLQRTTCGKGKATALTFSGPWQDLAEQLAFARFVTNPASSGSALPYLAPDGRFVVYVFPDRSLPQDARVIGPSGAVGTAIVCAPDETQPREVALSE